MPPPGRKTAARSKPNAAQKEQISEKVREIQQRQTNWLKQRDQHIKNDPETHPLAEERTAAKPYPPEKYSTNGHAKHKPDILKVHHNDSTHLFIAEVSDKLNVKVKHGFGAWLKSHKDERETGDEDYHEQSHYEGEPSSVSMSAALQQLKPEVSSRSSNRNYPLSPEEFDTLADSIASRVKRDLGIANGQGDGQSKPNHSHTHHRQDNEHSDEKSESICRGRTFVQNNSMVERGIPHGGVGEGVNVSSHCCPFCSVLMATAKHVPMLLVPCGHTVCKHCTMSHSSCRLCGTRMVSLTTNIMLQQIIHEFHRKNHLDVRANESQQNTHASLVNGRREECPPKTTVFNNDVNYSIQLQSLIDRKQVMQDEVTSRRRERDRILSKVQRAEKQLDAIEREEQGLVEHIQRLEEKLQGLRHHKDEYVTEYQQLKEEERVSSQQVELVDSTLKSLGDEIDKVRFLAEGQMDIYGKKRGHHP